MAGTGSRLIRITMIQRRWSAIPAHQTKAGTGSRLIKTTNDTAPVVGSEKQEEKLVNTQRKVEKTRRDSEKQK